MDKNKAMKLALDALLIWEKMHPKTTASAIRSPAIQALQEALEQPECSQHPDAPHGFNRESSHSLGRYVCDCEGWEPEEQEPVSYIYEYTTPNGEKYYSDEYHDAHLSRSVPVYLTPPKREWVGLTDEEINYIWGITKPDYEDVLNLPRAIEAKLREKNGF